MEVILKKDVIDLGRFGDIVRVTRGYARNYLIPRGFAVEATPGNKSQLNAEKGAYLRKEDVRKGSAQRLGAEVSALTLTFQTKAGEDEKLFGSVTVHDIEKELATRGYHLVEKSWILLQEPIKKLGSYAVEIKLHPEVTVSIKVEVVTE